MRLTTLRNLLLVLAMVTQTVAGGAGLARAASIFSEETLSTSCHHVREAENTASNDKAGRHHNCHSCLLCGGPPAAWISSVEFHVVALAAYALIDPPVNAAPSRFERLSRAHSARAPPVSRA
ncbi:MAG: hypothetical protein U1E25_12190 [Methylocystis sp.]